MTNVHPLSPIESTDTTGVPSQSSSRQQRKSRNRDRQRATPKKQENQLTDNGRRGNTTTTSNNINTKNKKDHDDDIHTKNSPGKDSIQSDSNSSAVSAIEFVEISPQPSARRGLVTTPASMISGYDDDDDDDVVSWQEDLLLENRQRPSNERLLVSVLHFCVCF